MESYLPVIWAAIIGCAVAMYVILDGFDLGIGILFPFAESDHQAGVLSADHHHAAGAGLSRRRI